MYGPNVDGLQVYKVINSYKTLVWTRANTQGMDWRWAQIGVAGNQAYRVCIYFSCSYKNNDKI